MQRFRVSHLGNSARNAGGGEKTDYLQLHRGSKVVYMDSPPRKERKYVGQPERHSHKIRGIKMMEQKEGQKGQSGTRRRGNYICRFVKARREERDRQEANGHFVTWGLGCWQGQRNAPADRADTRALHILWGKEDGLGAVGGDTGRCQEAARSPMVLPRVGKANTVCRTARGPKWIALRIPTLLGTGGQGERDEYEADINHQKPSSSCLSHRINPPSLSKPESGTGSQPPP